MHYCFKWMNKGTTLNSKYIQSSGASPSLFDIHLYTTITSYNPCSWSYPAATPISPKSGSSYVLIRFSVLGLIFPFHLFSLSKQGAGNGFLKITHILSQLTNTLSTACLHSVGEKEDTAS
jgi:hypothetical protein